MTFRALIVDDEELARAIVREHLSTHADIQILGEAANGFEAVKLAAELKPDLIFLDVQMPKLDGFEVLALLEGSPAIVFVTAFEQHALRAFNAHAVDYLLKPFSRERFDAAMEKARRANGGRPVADLAPALQNAAREGKPLDRIVVKDGPQVTIIPLDKLDFIQAQDDYVLLKTEGRERLKQQTLSSLESQLDPARFIRVHRSYIINLERLVRLEQDSKEHWEAVLQDGRRVPVSKAGYQRLRPLWCGN